MNNDQINRLNTLSYNVTKDFSSMKSTIHHFKNLSELFAVTSSLYALDDEYDDGLIISEMLDSMGYTDSNSDYDYISSTFVRHMSDYFRDKVKDLGISPEDKLNKYKNYFSAISNNNPFSNIIFNINNVNAEINYDEYLVEPDIITYDKKTLQLSTFDPATAIDIVYQIAQFDDEYVELTEEISNIYGNGPLSIEDAIDILKDRDYIEIYFEEDVLSDYYFDRDSILNEGLEPDEVLVEMEKALNKALLDHQSSIEFLYIEEMLTVFNGKTNNERDRQSILDNIDSLVQLDIDEMIVDDFGEDGSGYW